MNTKYGRLTNGRIEYAPISLDTGDGVKMNPSEASYLAAGWKKVVDVRPTTEPGCRVEVSGWNESEDTLTCVYKVVPGEAPATGPRVFSKLKLVAAPQGGGQVGSRQDVGRGARVLRLLCRRAELPRGQPAIHRGPRRHQGLRPHDGRAGRGDPLQVHLRGGLNAWQT